VIASISSAICYGFYVIVVVATASNYPIWIKILLTAVTNLVGVYGGMFIMDKLRKDHLWEIVATIRLAPNTNIMQLIQESDNNDLSYNYDILNADKQEYVLTYYSHNKKESIIIKNILTQYNAKYIVHEETVRL